jgi:NAD(P)-dependent dehydrogenase (short-subunit alcohol dehydrogenase family)
MMNQSRTAPQSPTPAPARVVLVTGAAKRIGREIAITMAQRGWDVAVHYGQSSAEAAKLVAEVQAIGQRAVALQCDLAHESEVKTLLPRAIAALGSVSCVVNNASLFEQDSADDFSQKQLDRHMHINLAAPLLLAQALHAATADGEQACVINLLDQKLYNLNPDFMSYTLSKAALQCATTTLAQAFAPRLRVVGIAPGISLVSGDQSDADFAQAHQRTPLGRSSTAQDIASTVCFVADAAAITGTTILVDGGQHLIPLQRDVMFIASAPPVSSL